LTPPDVIRPVSVDALAANPAVDLFVRRAQAVKPDFALTEANAGAVAAICQKLEGLPLALELAAARIRILPPQAMLVRLEHRLTFLGGGAVDLPARQRTMRAAIDWSYDLLDPAERMLFRRLGVFVGGCAIPAIEAVCAAAGAAPLDVLDGLESLQRNSLIRLEETADDEPRFAMLAIVREYARERLAASREEDELRRRHARHYLAFAEGTRRLHRPAQGPWLDRLGREHDNLRAAVRWCIETGNAEMGLRLASALWMFWYVGGDAAEGRALLAALLALPDAAVATAPRAESLLGAGQLAMTQGDYAVARGSLEESLALYRALDDEWGTAEALLAAGFVARVQEEYDAARALLEEALARSRAVGHRFMTAASLHHLGMMAADARGDAATARSFLEESLALYRALGFQRFIALVLRSLGDVARTEGEYVRARRLLRESLTTMVGAGDRLGIGGVLGVVAHLAADEGQAERAVRLAGAAARERERHGTRPWPVEERRREGWLPAARDVLGDELFQRVWAEGRAMYREQAVAYAREDAGDGPP
jgi:tetratricopeptide (TPR) repeat protein